MMYWVVSIFLLVGLSTLATQTTVTPPLPPWSLSSPRATRPTASQHNTLTAQEASRAVSMSRDLVIHFYDKIISTQELLIKLNMTSHRFSVNNLCPSPQYSCEAVCPLNESNQARERMYQKPCYCDKLCLELGDCCYDYFKRCVADLTPKRHLVRRVCVKTTKTNFYGYTMAGSCPSDNSDKNLETLCTSTSSPLELPVLDLDDNSVYKNIFCAKCNRASNPVYWKFSASCDRRYITASDIPKNRTRMLNFLTKNCDWEFTIPLANINLKKCLSVKVRCRESESENSLLFSLCSFYAFPVCESVQSKNPHCEMCRGNDISSFFCVCNTRPVTTAPPPVGGIPSLDILFDFSSSSDHSVKIGDKTTIVTNRECSHGFLYNPFTERCVRLHVVDRPVTNNESFTNYRCEGSSFVKVGISSVTVLPNGSIWIPLHKRTYNNGSYFFNGSFVFVCVNLTRNFTETTTLNSEDEKLSGRQIMTYVGCAISITSLILLLGVYIIFLELRTLPGKNLMSLSISMLFYHTFFLMSGQTNRPHLCKAVSILLHYVLLSTFFWMSVMAFDVAKTFTKKGQTSRSVARSRSFIKYHIYAWTSPAIIVITSSALDISDVAFIGYGDRFCWISNGKALLFVLGVPVALILMFNCVAITITLSSIWKVQKSTRRVTDQKASLSILYIKLSSALGFTWLLGFIVPFAKVDFLTYLFVICNSLQGFFISLAFVANKRTLVNFKCAWRSLSKSHGSTNTTSNTGKNRATNTSKGEQLAATTAL